MAIVFSKKYIVLALLFIACIAPLCAMEVEDNNDAQCEGARLLYNSRKNQITAHINDLNVQIGAACSNNFVSSEDVVQQLIYNRDLWQAELHRLNYYSKQLGLVVWGIITSHVILRERGDLSQGQKGGNDVLGAIEMPYSKRQKLNNGMALARR